MDRDTDRWIRSEEARVKFRALIDLVTQDDAHVYILRYDTPAAVVVPVRWYEQMKADLGKRDDSIFGETAGGPQ